MKLFIGNWKILGNDSDILSYPEQKRDIAQLLQYLDKKMCKTDGLIEGPVTLLPNISYLCVYKIYVL